VELEPEDVPYDVDYNPFKKWHHKNHHLKIDAKIGFDTLARWEIDMGQKLWSCASKVLIGMWDMNSVERTGQIGRICKLMIFTSGYSGYTLG